MARRASVESVADSLRNDAKQAIGLVVEGACPLFRVGLRIHDGRACCPCCGDSYKAAENRKIWTLTAARKSSSEWLRLLTKSQSAYACGRAISRVYDGGH
jgi:uncharacterized Zn finger protein (UPF0148 family)